jgi:uncharacterized protein (TIGR02001 family)
MKTTTALFTVALTAFATVHPDRTAHAEDGAVAANVSFVSDYRFRGIMQTNAKPAVQGGFDWEFGPFSIGTWASNVSWLSDLGAGVSSSMELDVYAGYSVPVGEQSVDLGLTYYYYPGTFPNNLTSPNTGEFSIGTSLGALDLGYSVSLTNLFGFDDSKGSGYLDVTYATPVSGFNLSLHVGYQDIRNNDDCPYADWSISAGQSYSGLDFSLAYIDTNAKDACWVNAFNRNLGKATVVLSVGKTL